MNQLTIIGNLTGDPELRTTPAGVNVCTFTVAVNRRHTSNKDGRQTDFFRVAAWRQLGENCSRYLSKGKKVCITGEVGARAYEGKDGTLRASLEVTAEKAEFLSPRNEQDQAQRQQDDPSENGWGEINDEELPFEKRRKL